MNPELLRILALELSLCEELLLYLREIALLTVLTYFYVASVRIAIRDLPMTQSFSGLNLLIWERCTFAHWSLFMLLHFLLISLLWQILESTSTLRWRMDDPCPERSVGSWRTMLDGCSYSWFNFDWHNVIIWTIILTITTKQLIKP